MTDLDPDTAKWARELADNPQTPLTKFERQQLRERGYIDDPSHKQRFSAQVKHSFEFLIREAIANHPLLRFLPPEDKINAARCATRHGLLAVRSQSVVDLYDKLDEEEMCVKNQPAL